MIVEDFTTFQPGFVVPLEGRVELCPRCGRPGLEEFPLCGEPYFLHSQRSDLFSDGLRTEPIDYCARSGNHREQIT